MSSPSRNKLNSNISNLKRVSFFGQAMADADYGFSATTSAPCHGYAEEIYPNHFNIHLEMKIARGSEYQNNNQVYEVFAMHFLTQQLGVSTINWNPYATRASIISNANLITNYNEIIGRSGLLVIKYNNDVYELGRIYDNSTYGAWGHDSGLYKANVGIMIDIYDAITL